MKDEKFLTGVILTFLSAVTFSAKAIFVKLAYKYDIDPTSLICLRLLFSVPFFIVILIYSWRSKHPRLSVKDHLWLIAVAIFGFYLSVFLDFWGLLYLSAGLERIILFSYPAMVVLMTRLFFKERISRRAFIALLITYLGIVISYIDEVSVNGANQFKGVVLILACSLFYAGYMVASQSIISKIGSLRFTAYVMIVATGAGLIHQTLVKPLQFGGYPSEVYRIALTMAIVSTVIPTLLLSEGIKRVGASRAAIINTIGPIATIYLAHVYLGEDITALQLVGGALVVIGVVFLSQRRKIAKIVASRPEHSTI